MLKDGSMVTGGRAGVLPKGMQYGTKLKVIEEVEGTAVAEEHAMATVIKSVEGLMPTYDEAIKQPD